MKVHIIAGWNDDNGVRWNAFYSRNARSFKQAMDSAFRDCSFMSNNIERFPYFGVSAGVYMGDISNQFPKEAIEAELRGHGKQPRNGHVYLCSSDGQSLIMQLNKNVPTAIAWHCPNAADYVNFYNINEPRDRALGV